MQIRPEDRAFLANVDAFNERYNVIHVGQDVERLQLSFWRDAEIAKSEALKDDWDVASHLIPFYGDWHDLICLDMRTGEVVYVDDDRRVRHTWDSSEEFSRCLTWVDDVAPSDDLGIVDVWLDPSLDD